MAINIAAKYSNVVDERFTQVAVTTPAINTEYDFTGVKTVNVYGVATSPMNDYAATGTNRYGTPGELQDTVQELTLSQDRSFTYTIDRKNYVDTMMTKEAGKSLARQLAEVVVPEIDIYRLAKMSAGAGNTATTAITKANAYESFLDGIVALTNNKVPTAGRVAFVSAAFNKLIKLDDSFIKASDIAQNMLLNGQIGMIDGIPLILVPSSYLPTDTAFLITNPIATTSPIKLADYKIHDNPPGINGWLVEGRVYYDAFVLGNKKHAIYLHKTA